MEQEENVVIAIIKYIGCGFIGVGILTFFIKLPDFVFRYLIDERWKIKHSVERFLTKIFPKLYKLELLSEKDIGIPKVNSQCLIIIENLPKSTIPRELVRFLGLRDLVHKEKLVKLSVAADRKGSCAGLAVALVPRYCLHDSSILNKDNSVYQGNVIKVREVKNRKINLLKHVHWLSSDKWDHIGLQGRFRVYDNILGDVETHFGYYLTDGGSYVQYCTGDTEKIIDESAEFGINRIVMKVRYPSDSAITEFDWCESYPGFVFTTVGHGPKYAENAAGTWNNNFCTCMLDKSKKKHVVAFGELGIMSSTKYNSWPPIERQKILFEDQVSLASNYNKPVLVVTNGKLDVLLEILEKFPKVTACLTLGKHIPSDEELYKWTQKGHYLGITGAIWTNWEENFWIPTVFRNILCRNFILCSNSPMLESNSKCKAKEFDKQLQNCEHYKNVSPGSKELLMNRFHCTEETEDEVEFEPKGLCVVLELLASCLNQSPVVLAKILNENAEQFYNFDSVSNS